MPREESPSCCSPALRGSPARSQQPKRAADLDAKLMLLLNSKKSTPKSGVEGRLPAKQSLPRARRKLRDATQRPELQRPEQPPAALPETCSLFNKPYQESSSKISSSRGSAPNELDGKPRGRLLAAASCPQSLRSPRCDSGHPTHTGVPEFGARSPFCNKKTSTGPPPRGAAFPKRCSSRGPGRRRGSSEARVAFWKLSPGSLRPFSRARLP